ncbi:MAG: DUF2513 domain-containing protein [Pseudomonadales bacterium]
MKRDWDLVRKILMRVESLEYGQELRAGDIEGYDSPVVSHHLRILMEAGLIDVIEFDALGDWEGIATRLTWDGHEFIDQIRSDTIWRKVKDRLTHEGLSASFHAIRAIADGLVRSALG